MMYRYDSTCLRFDKNPTSVVPEFKNQTERITCCHCGRITVVMVATEIVDWKSVADVYKDFANEMARHYAQIAADTEAMYGDNPARLYFANEIRMMLLNLNRENEG